MKIIGILLILLLSACTPTPTPTRPPSMPKSPYIAEPSPTPIRHNVTFLAFHDYNSNGEWEEDTGEPLLPGINISSGVHNCTTGDEGTCTTIGVEEGAHNFLISAPDRFTYYTPSILEEIPVVEGIMVHIDEDTTVKIPLVEGYQ